MSGGNESDGGEQEQGSGSKEEESDGGDNGEGNADHAESDEAELKQETYTVTMPEYHAENTGMAEVKTLIGGVTWNSTPAYDGDTAGTYTFTAALPENYTLAEGVSMPEIRVTVQDGSDDTAVWELLARIAALPEAEEILAKEPEAEDEEAYEEWTAELSVYGEEAFAILEAYEDLTEEQQAQIPGEAAAKLMAWVELVDMITGGAETLAGGTCGDNATWKIAGATLKIEGTGAMKDYDRVSDLPWKNQFFNQIQIGDGITHIGKNAFAEGIGIQAVSKIDIPTSVSSIGAGAFSGCTQLNEIKFNWTEKEDIAELSEGLLPDSVSSISIPGGGYCEYLLAYLETPGWLAYKDKLGYRLRHNSIEKIEAKEPTCMVAGNKEYWQCQKCKELFSDNTANTPTTLDDVVLPINADNHSYTYTANGAVITESCANGCGHSATATLSVKSGANLTYTGSEITPVTVTYSNDWGGTGADKPDDAAISYSNNINAGDAVASLTIAEQTANLTFAVAPRNIGKGSGIMITNGSYPFYNGKEQTVRLGSVKVNSETLTEGKDYTLSDNKATDAGKYTMTITGMGNYTGTRGCPFYIRAASLTNNMVTIANGPHYYTGNAVTPAVTVRNYGSLLTEGTDYTVSYKDNINAGTATVTIEGQGNYEGTVDRTFTITYSPIPSGKSPADYITVSPAPVDGWYNSEITLSPKSGCGIGETIADIGNAAITIPDETGTNGNRKTILIRDGNGSIYQTAFPYKLDKTPPVIDLSNMSVTNGTKGLWNWIIGKKKMIIRIPEADITDALSGIKEVTYTATPDNGAQQTQTIQAQGGSYEISLNAEFGGTIKLTAKDKAGNATELSLTAADGKVIAEDHAPIVTITMPDTPKPNENGWYNTAVSVKVTVTDDKSADDSGILSGGIAEIQWKDGENGAAQTVAGLPGTSPVYKKEFTISVDTDGAHTYYVKAVDNAGNGSGWQTVTVQCDTGRPVFTEAPAASNHTQEGADITFTPSEGGKAYWLVNPETEPGAQEVVEKGAQNNCVKEDMVGESPNSFTLTGLTPGESHTVYVVLEDAAGNLSEVKAVSFGTLQKAPEISLGDLGLDHEKETIKIPDRIGEVEVYTDPENPSESKIQPDATDGSLPVEPGTTIYIRYPEKTQDGVKTPASESVEISIPGRPAAPSQKQISVTDTTVTVKDPIRGEEYILVPKGSVPAGQEPDWSGAKETGAFTGLDPNQGYELWVRKKATGNDFASEPSKMEVRTYVTVKEPAVTGEGAGKNGNTAPKPAASDAGGGTVPFTGTYGEEYTPVIKVDGREISPETTWDERAGKGTWEYPYPITEDEDKIEITVEFRKRTVTAITVTPESLKIYADHAANRSAAEAGSMAPLTAWLEEECILKAAYDNKTEGTVQRAVYATTDHLAPKGGDYSYTVTAEGETAGITLTVMPVNAAVTAPPKVTQMQKSGGYTQAEVAAWLPAQVTVTYTGTGYTAKTENRPVTWNTAAIDAGFGGTSGEKAVSGTVALPDWATGQKDVSISIAFVDKQILTDAQMNLSVSGWTYGAQEEPAPRGSVSVADTNPVIAYLYSADGGVSWTEAERLPKSGSGHTVPGAYQVKMTYTGDGYRGTKTAAFTVEKRTLTVEKGTLEAEDKNYDGTLAAALKEGGELTLSGVLTGDAVSPGGTLRAEFAEAGPKKNIAVTVTGFELKGRDAECYVIGNTSITLRAAINKADGTPPSDGKKPGGTDKDKDKDKDKETGSNVEDESSGGANSDGDGTENGGETGNGGETNSEEGPTPVVPPKKPENTSDTTSSAETDRPAEERHKPKPGGSPTGSGTVRNVTAAADQGRIVISGEKVPTGNVAGMEQASTAMTVGNGAVFVTVVCEDEKYAAGVNDTAAVANAVLSSEQVQLVNDGGTIEIRVDVKDISEKIPQQDQEVIENGLVEYQKEVPTLTLGRYIDISMFMRIGESDWDAITSTEEPIEVVVGIPEDMREDSREFYIIRAHEGEHTFMRDLDEESDTVTISTDMFSSYAIAYAAAGNGGDSVCSLCHICPTFLGVCCFIWLAAVTVVILFGAVVILRWKKEEK